jgi:ATP-dependent DNA helicase RecQ
MGLTGAIEGDWRKIRESILRRDKFKCVECGDPCDRDEADIHHLLPRSAGGSDEPSNLITLCDGCHAAHHPKAGVGCRAERWAVRLARWLDARCSTGGKPKLWAGVWLLGRFRDGQLPVVQAAHGSIDFGRQPDRLTLCFQLPAVLRRRVSVVVSPLKALMGEQVSSLLRRKIPSSYINSDIGSDEKRLRYRLLASNHFKLLYVAPERFFVQNINEQQLLRSVRPASMASCI